MVKNVIEETDGFVHGYSVVAFVRPVVEDHLNGMILLEFLKSGSTLRSYSAGSKRFSTSARDFSVPYP